MSEQHGFCRCVVLSVIYLFCGAIFSFILGLYVFWLIFRPHNIRFSVTDATLLQFDLISSKNDTTTTMTLHYNLALNVTVTNPNKKVVVHYRRIRAIASYGDKRFGSVVLLNSGVPLDQGRKNVTVLHSVFLGQSAAFFEKNDIERYYSEKRAGIFRVDVKLDLRMKLGYGKIKTGILKPPMVECVFRVPLGVNVGFEATNNCGHVRTSLVLPKD